MDDMPAGGRRQHDYLRLSGNDYDNNVSRLLANVLGEPMRRPGKRSAREGLQEIAPS